MALDLKKVQGDSIIGFPKKAETFYFFSIKSTRVNEFRQQLGELVKLISSADKVLQDHKNIAAHKQAGRKDLLKISGINIGFSQKGLDVILGAAEKEKDIKDDIFKKGMFAGATDLNDDPAKWDAAFKGGVHGLILVAGESASTVNEEIAIIDKIFKVAENSSSIVVKKRLHGKVRPGDQDGHEHFGFLDGISEPRVAGIPFPLTPHPDDEPKQIPQGTFLLDRDGDEQKGNRPSWSKDGSIIAFRLLPQLVPEFDNFVKSKSKELGMTADLLGARLVGRWKSGAPIDLTPNADDKVLAADENRNNKFQYTVQETQERCPFSAHIRKTNPRKDLPPGQPGQPAVGGGASKNRILRRGIQFGDELTKQEIASGRTALSRGLLFLSYQSVLGNGFQFIQSNWSNNTGFIFDKKTKDGKRPLQPGFDPISGQAGLDPQTGKQLTRGTVGANPKKPDDSINLPTDWVISHGGEYFFAPSIPALRDRFATKPATAQALDVGRLSLGAQGQSGSPRGGSPRPAQAGTASPRGTSPRPSRPQADSPRNGSPRPSRPQGDAARGASPRPARPQTESPRRPSPRRP